MTFTLQKTKIYLHQTRAVHNPENFEARNEVKFRNIVTWENCKSEHDRWIRQQNSTYNWLPQLNKVFNKFTISRISFETSLHIIF